MKTTIKISSVNREDKFNLKSNLLKPKFIPNSTKNKKSINFLFKPPQPIIITNPKKKCTFNKIPLNNNNTPRIKSTSKEKSRLKMPAFINPDNSKRKENSIQNKNVIISSKNIVKHMSKRDIKTSTHRTNFNSNVTYQKEFTTTITASNQNILDKMKTFSITNNYELREVFHV